MYCSPPISLARSEFEAKNSPSPIFAPIANQISIGPNTDFKSREKFLPNVNLTFRVARKSDEKRIAAGLFLALHLTYNMHRYPSKIAKLVRLLQSLLGSLISGIVYLFGIVFLVLSVN